MSTKKRTELRLALGMRGGVSLAVWIGGACAEIDELRRAKSVGKGFWWEVLQATDKYDRVVVDVLAGASAGGLNGVLFAAAIRNGFRMDSLLRVWKDVASVDKLRRRNEPWISLFDGDERFLDVIRDQLTDLIAKSPQKVDDPSCYVDLQLSATLIDPLNRAAISPGDEKLRRSRSTARFHFRHDPRAAPPRLDIESGDVGRLAVAARATASFPMAFEAAAVRATRPPQFQPRPPAASASTPRPADRAEATAQLPADERAAALARLRLVDCRGVFSESRGAPKVDGTEFCDDDFVVADGGIVDNIPLGRALDAVRDAPADRPTRRVLVYLHPTGPSGIAARAKAKARFESTEERHVRRRGPLATAVGLMASQVQGESIDGDLEQLEEHNRAVRLATVLRLAVLDELTAPPAGDGRGRASSRSPLGPVQLATSRLSGYLLQRAGADAVSIQRLLRDPLGVLGEDPFPQAPISSAAEHRDDRWRSPLARWTPEQRLQLDLRLRALFNGLLGNRQMGKGILKGGLGPLSRAIALLLELAREGEKVSEQAEALGQQKRRLYRLASLVREMDRFRQLGWVAEAGNFRDTDNLSAWLNAARIRLNLLLCCSTADAAVLCDPDADDAAFALAYSNYFGNVAAALQATISGGTVPKPDGPVDDIRDTLVARLELVTDEILDLLPPLEAAEQPSLTAGDAAEARRRCAEVIQRVLEDGSATFVDRLAALEVLLLSEHLVGAPGGVEIGFARMSAAAPVINAKRFSQLHKYSVKLNPEFTKDGDHLVPDVKLAGNELASFSAFLDEDWRVNDWTWGRMDAVATLLDLLLGEDLPLDERPDLARFAGIPGDTGWKVAASTPTNENLADRQAMRRALIGRRQAEILSDATGDGLPPDLSTWQAGLETLVRPGTPDLAKQVSDVSSVAARVIGVALPRTVPRITGQLDGVARRLAMRLARPTGELPPLPGGPEPAPPEPEGTPLKTLGLAALAGVGVAGVVWAISDHPVSLAVGLLVGLVVAFVPGALLLWLAVQRPTDDDPRDANRLVFVALALALDFSLLAGAVVALLWQVRD